MEDCSPLEVPGSAALLGSAACVVLEAPEDGTDPFPSHTFKRELEGTACPVVSYKGLCPGCEDAFAQHLPTCIKMGRTGRYTIGTAEVFDNPVEEESSLIPTVWSRL